MVTELSASAGFGETLLIWGVYVKSCPALGIPLTVTTTLPVKAPAGALTLMLVLLQAITVALTPENATLEDCVPKLFPVIVTDVPLSPDEGEMLVIEGVGVKKTPLLDCPPTVTTIGPAVAPAGTWATMLLSVHPVVVAIVPLNVTVPPAVPNPAP